MAVQICSEHCHTCRKNLTGADGRFQTALGKVAQRALQVLMLTPTHKTVSAAFPAQTGVPAYSSKMSHVQARSRIPPRRPDDGVRHGVRAGAPSPAASGGPRHPIPRLRQPRRAHPRQKPGSVPLPRQTMTEGDRAGGWGTAAASLVSAAGLRVTAARGRAGPPCSNRAAPRRTAPRRALLPPPSQGEPGQTAAAGPPDGAPPGDAHPLQPRSGRFRRRRPQRL